MSSIDLKAAFNTIDHSSLWNILQTLGASPKLVVLKQLYSSVESCVHANGKDPAGFPSTAGSDKAAPNLFNCIIDHLMTRVCDWVPSRSFGNHILADLKYADDTILSSAQLFLQPVERTTDHL